METTVIKGHRINTHTNIRMFNDHDTYKEKLTRHWKTRKDINLNFILYLIFKIFGFDIKKLFQNLTTYLYNEKFYTERKKFLIKCKFYCVVPNHLDYITKNVRKNYLFSKKCKLKQDTLTDKIRVQLLNIEIRDLHARIFHTKRNIQKTISNVENIVGINIMSLFLEYYMTKLKFIISPLRNNLEKKLDKIFFKKYNEWIDKDRYFDLERNNTSVNELNHNTQVFEPFITENKYEKWCVNVSGIQLPSYVIDTLKLGEKFNFNDNFNKQLTLPYLKNFETYINNHIDDNMISKIRGTFLWQDLLTFTFVNVPRTLVFLSVSV